MAEIFDYNPARGTWYEIEDDNQSGGVLIHTKQDIAPILKQVHEDRASGDNEARNRKTGMLKYATIPAHVELEIKQKYGLSIYDKNATGRLLRIIDSDYPYLKTTTMKHRVND